METTWCVVTACGAVILASAGLSACSAEAQPALPDDFDRRVEGILKRWGAPGAVVVIVKDGAVLLQRGYGTTRVGGGSPVTPSTLTSVASVTKTLNATALALLVDDGVLSWDDPVGKHIPEFQFADAYRTEHTTLRDLLSHRAGLPPLLGGLWDMDYSIPDLLRQLPAAEPRIAFRQRIDYSQVGIALLGEVVARASGLDWAAFVQTRIFDPLGMTASYPGTEAFLRRYPGPGAVAHLMGRAVLQDGRVVDGEWRGPGRIYTPAGGIVTTGEDMARFMLMLLNGGRIDGRRLLRPERIEEMHAPQEVEASPYGPVMNPLGSLVCYCLGWIAHDYEGRRIAEHPGSNFGSSTVALMPSEGIGVFVSSGATYSLDSDRMVSALKFEAFDLALGLPGRDWQALLGSEDTPTGSDRSVRSADGVPIHYQVVGAGEPTLLLVHGWSNDRRFWEPHTTTLSRSYRVVSLDLAGFGTSGRDRTSWTMQRYGEDVTAVARALPGRPVVAAGFSMGGAAVLEAARLVPERIAGVVLVDILHDPDAQYSEPVVAEFVAGVRSTWRDPATVRALGFSPDTPEPLVERYIAATPPAPPDYWWAALGSFFRWADAGLRDTLARVHVPVRAINAQQPATNLAAWRRHVPTFQVAILPGVGHLGMLWERTDQFDRLVREAVDSIMR
ncbi:MAG: alpha/beta fold hydrolase [Candidatus Latescibacterota bacterium]